MNVILKIKSLLLVLVCFSMLSCESWLQVKSEDRIMEDNLYNNPEGFMTALNGIYIDLMNRSLYGLSLIQPFDIMAQCYNCRQDEHVYRGLATYDPGARQSAASSGIWQRAYFLLANINTLLEHCESDRGVLNDQYYHVIKGEALALRAMLHFELFRIYGPIYSEDKEVDCIPYATSSEPVMLSLSKASVVVEKITNDLTEAEKLLEGYDPVITEGPLFSEEEGGASNAMRYRQVRLNYYAVLGLTARAALYFGDKEKAFNYASKVIKEAQEDNAWFPFVTGDAATASGVEDRVYMTEILFGMYNLKRTQLYYEASFSSSLGETAVLRVNPDIQKIVYEGDVNDYRNSYWFQDMKDPDNNNTRHFIKYMGQDKAGTESSSPDHFYMVPLIRISEMYYIAAECCPDPVKAREYLNTVRNARNIAKIPDEAELMPYIEKEYRKEFIGEGQLFWFYKRLFKKELPSGTIVGEKIPMEKSFYLFSLPQSEMDYRGENQK